MPDNVRLEFTRDGSDRALAQPAEPSDRRVPRPLAGPRRQPQLHPGTAPHLVHPAGAAGESRPVAIDAETQPRPAHAGRSASRSTAWCSSTRSTPTAVEAIWRLDRCCGHPSPGIEYHYHKYPVCVKSPWTDDGTAHSPLIGFAFDGFPIYGPYEAAGELAKDSTATRSTNSTSTTTKPAAGTTT